VSRDEAAPPAGGEHARRNLLLRVVAALVLAPTTIALAYAGGWLWIALVTLASIGLYVEWLMIVGTAREMRVLVSGAVALAIVAICLAAERVDTSLLAAVLGVAAVSLLSPKPRGWPAAGFLYAAAAEIASVLVRLDHVEGFIGLMFVLLIVWVTDIGGYFVGRGVGGPKLWPRVSPKKTWVGAIGGFAASLAVAAAFFVFDPHKSDSLLMLKMERLLLLAAALSVASQLGDLFESAVKRHFNVKDSSHLIPGHGGVLDRFDSLYFVIPTAAAMYRAFGVI